jgi:hypothetical protein
MKGGRDMKNFGVLFLAVVMRHYKNIRATKEKVLAGAVFLFAVIMLCNTGSDLAIAAERNVPLPDYTVSENRPSDPPVIKELLGKWSGNWEGYLDSTLVITEIDAIQKCAKVIYAWGDSRAWGSKKGYNQIVAEYVPGEKPMIRWGGAGRSQFEFTLKEGKLEGSRSSQWRSSGSTGGYTNFVTMVKEP